MEDKSKEQRPIFLSRPELDIGKPYDQDIGTNYRIENDEIKYTETTNIDEVKSYETEEKTIEQLEIIETSIEKDEPQIEKSNSETSDIITKPKRRYNKKQEKGIVKYIYFAIVIISIAIIFFAIKLINRRKNIEEGFPNVELIGDKLVILKLGEPYTELGYVAYDKKDGDITDKVKIKGEIDINRAGIYQKKYEVMNSEFLKSNTVRNIIVESGYADFNFKLVGENIVFVKIDGDFIEEGYEATLNDQNLSDKVEVFSNLNRKKEGIYKIYYVLNHNDQTAVLQRTVIVYKGNEKQIESDIATELNNWLVDELHYSNKINNENISPSVLLYFGAINCQNDNNKIKNDVMISCLKDMLNMDIINLPTNTKYNGKTGTIKYDNNSESWIIERLDLPRLKDSLYKIIEDDEKIYFYELYAYPVMINNKEICDGNNNTTYYSGVDLTNVLGYSSCTNNGEEKVYNNQYNKVFYIHEFEKRNDKYYWVSSEMMK